MCTLGELQGPSCRGRLAQPLPTWVSLEPVPAGAEVTSLAHCLRFPRWPRCVRRGLPGVGRAPFRRANSGRAPDSAFLLLC